MGIDVMTLTAFLTPFLPFLLKVGEKATEGAAEQFGVDAWEKAKSVWAKLYPKVKAKEATKEAVEDLAAAPEDKDLQTALRVQLKKLLEKDTALAEEILQIMQQDLSTATSTVTNIEQQGEIKQEAGDNAIQIGQVGGDANIKR